MKIIRNLLLIILIPATLLQTGARRLTACAIEGWGACFWFESRAAFDLERFSGGYLGVIQPTWARSYLVVAYLTLERGPLPENTQRQMLEFWQGRLEENGFREPSSSGTPIGAAERWIRARNDAGRKCIGFKELSDIEVFRAPEGGPGWQAYKNCGDDAFRTAVETLASLGNAEGHDLEYICSWIDAQDTVFSNCGGGPPSIPEMAVGLAPDMAHLRRYQVAAAHFYAEQLDEAARIFSEISRDPDSPWWDIAPHLAVRCLLRKAEIGARTSRAVEMEHARIALEALLDDLDRAGPTGRAQRFLTYLESRLLPSTAIGELGQAILDQPPESTRFRDLISDYTILPVPSNSLGGDVRENSPEDPLTRWIRLVKSGKKVSVDPSARARTEALDLWRSEQKVIWLIPALMNSATVDPATEELLDAAAGVPLSDPAGPTLLAERLRLKPSDPDLRAEAWQTVTGTTVPWETRNLIASRLLGHAVDFEETVRLLPRKIVCDLGSKEDLGIFPLPCRSSSGTNEPLPDFILDCFGARLINFGLPLDRLRFLATNPKIDASLRREIGRAAWTRAVLIGDHRNGVAIADQLAKLDGKLAEPLHRYVEEATDVARERTALDILLWFPALSPHVPWCNTPWDVMSSNRKYSGNSWFDPWPAIPPPFTVRPPVWLGPEETSKLREELQSLSGPTENVELHHCRETLRWADESPDDPRIPAALYRAVRATMYARPSDAVEDCSRRAFTILHRLHPTSKWTKKTRYWYRGR